MSEDWNFYRYFIATEVAIFFIHIKNRFPETLFNYSSKTRVRNEAQIISAPYNVMKKFACMTVSLIHEILLRILSTCHFVSPCGGHELEKTYTPVSQKYCNYEQIGMGIVYNFISFTYIIAMFFWHSTIVYFHFSFSTLIR